MRLSDKRIYITTSLVTYTTAQQSLDSDCRQKTTERDDGAPSVSTPCTEITVVPCGGIPKMFKELFADDNERGVSPVIGVILMVAITVILAAVIGAFVLGLGDQVSTQAPQASIGFSFDGNGNVSLAHEGGDDITTSEIEVLVGGNVIYNGSDTAAYNANDSSPYVNDWNGSTISAGDTLKIAPDGIGMNGEDVRVVWNNPSGGSSNVLAERRWPN